MQKRTEKEIREDIARLERVLQINREMLEGETDKELRQETRDRICRVHNSIGDCNRELKAIGIEP